MANLIKPHSESTISTKDMIIRILSHSKFIIIFTFIFIALPVVFGLFSKDYYSIESIFKVNEFYDSYLIQDLNLPDFSAFSTYQNISDKHKVESEFRKIDSSGRAFESVYNSLIFSFDNVTKRISIVVPKTSEPDFFINLIDNLVKNEYLRISGMDKTIIDDEINRIEKIVDEISDSYPKENTGLLEVILNLNNKIRSLNEYKTFIDKPFDVIESFNVHKLPNSVQSLKTIVLSTLLGLFLALCLVLLVELQDNKIYSVETLINIIGEDRFLAAIPYYKDGKRIDNRFFLYISSKLNRNSCQKTIGSMNDFSGKHIISKSINNISNQTEIEVLPSFKEQPNVYLSDDLSDMIIIVKAGTDSVNAILSFDNDMKLKNKNIWYLLNYANPKDPDIKEFANYDDLKKRRFFTPNSKFYKSTRI